MPPFSGSRPPTPPATSAGWPCWTRELPPDASLDTPTRAFAIVRVSEGFLYSDVIADRTPDIGRAVTVIEALLRGLDLVNRASVR